MTNKHINIFFFAFFNIIVFYSQNIEGVITYKASSKKAIKYVKEEKESDKDKKIIKREVNNLYKNAKDIKAFLKFNNKISEYTAVDRMVTSSQENFNLTHIMSGGKNKYYTKKSDTGYKNSTLNCELLGECFLIESLLPEWELTQETKFISGYLCYKAILRNKRTGKKTVQAWYAPKIPYGYGIMDYYGLPGMILEISRNTILITAIKIQINPPKKMVIKEPEDVKKVNQEEFKKMQKKAFPGFYKN